MTRTRQPHTLTDDATTGDDATTDGPVDEGATDDAVDAGDTGGALAATSDTGDAVDAHDTADTADTTAPADAGNTTAPADERPRPHSHARLRQVGAAVLAVLLVLGGCAFFLGAHRLDRSPAARNRALSDTEATNQVAGEIANDLAHVFSYTPDGLDATERSARSVLAGRAARQYTELLDRIREDVTDQRVTLSTQAVRTGVIELHGDEAELLVFLDQTSRRGKSKKTSTAAAQLTVTARREKDQWRIVDIKTR